MRASITSPSLLVLFAVLTSLRLMAQEPTGVLPTALPGTTKLQALFDSNALVVHVPAGTYELTDTLRVNRGVTVIVQPGTKMVWRFDSKGNGIQFADGVTWFSPGSKFLVKWKGESEKPSVDDKGGHAAWLIGVKDAAIHGGEWTSEIGDGVYIGPAIVESQRIPCENIVIEGLDCSGNYRQGMSITSARNVSVENCTFQKTAGISPQAGVDVEPCNPKDPIVNIRFTGCRFLDNVGAGLFVNVARHVEGSEPVSVYADEACVIRPLRNRAFEVNGMGPEDPTPAKGTVEYRGTITRSDARP